MCWGRGSPKRFDVLRPAVVECRAPLLLLLLVCLGHMLGVVSSADQDSSEPSKALGSTGLRTEEEERLSDLDEDMPGGASVSPSRLRQEKALRTPTPQAHVPERRLVNDSACFHSHVQSAGLESVYAFSGGTSGLGICSSPWDCGISGTGDIYGGNFFKVHASGQGDTWSPTLESTQTSASFCDNVADWQVVTNTNGGIDYRTCKVTHPSTMWFSMFTSVNGTIDGFGFADAFARTSSSQFGWVPQLTPSSDRRRFSFTTGAALNNMDPLNRRRRSFTNIAQARGLFMRTEFTGSSQVSDPFPSVNHLIVVPDENGDWVQRAANEEVVITETAPVEMLLALTWTGTNNYSYSDTVIQTLLNAVIAPWCFWTPCAAPVGIANSATPACAEGNFLRHGASCAPRCANFFSPSVSSLTCSEGVLSPATFTCIGDPCTAPTTVTHAETNPCEDGGGGTSVVAHGASCIPRCTSGYSPNIASMACHLGTLTPSTFTCGGSSCPAPTGISDSLAPTCKEGDTIPHGGNCTARCKDLYFPAETSTSSENLTCAYGVLTPADFQCFGKECIPPTGIENAKADACAEGMAPMEHTGKCTTQCLEGYKSTTQFLSCNLGNFTPKLFKCNPAPCPQPSGILNSAETCVNDGKTCFESTCEEGVELQHGENCTTRCSAGYYGDPVTVSCQFGKMDPPAYTCLESGCFVPVWIENALTPPCDEGFFIPSGENCTTKCHEGYYVSEEQMRCLRGKLSPDRFECLGSPCQAPDTATYTQGMECDSCSNARSSATCQNGDLIQHGERCVSRCDPGYAPTAFSLDCRLGKLYPPGFGCTEVVDGFDHDSQLLDACRVSDVFRIDRLVAMRANLAFRSSGGDSALHLCALHGQKEIVRRLLLANAAANAPDSRKWTPLHVAASRGHAGTVAELLAHGGDVLAQNDAGATPGDLARKLAGAADPHLGKSLTGQQEAALVLMQAERLRANQDCANDHICPAPLPGGWRVDSTYTPGMQVHSVEVNENDSTVAMFDVNHTNTTNNTPHDTADVNHTNASNNTLHDTATPHNEEPAAHRGDNLTNGSNSTSTPASTTSTTATTATTSTTSNSSTQNLSNHTESDD